MRIAQIATLTEAIPPTWHGGIENVISIITEELVKRGHDVTLFASADSKTKARLVPLSKISFRNAGKPDVFLEFAHANKAFLRAGEFDIIHNHTDFGLGFPDFVQTPCVTTLHSPFAEEEGVRLLENFAHLNYVALSYSHKRNLSAWLNIVKVVYNGINVADFPFNDKKQDYMLFLGRIHPDKGTDIAIEAAIETGKPLVIAAHIDRYNQRFFNEIIKPRIDNKLIFFEGEVNSEQKKELLQNASCVLCPFRGNESFGLVLIEALACGTPVVALNKGSVEELIIDGKTGFIAETPSGLAYGIENSKKISPSFCRKHVEENFSHTRMVDDYIKVYEKLIHDSEKKTEIKNIAINIRTPVQNLPLIYSELAEFLKIPLENIIRYMEQSHDLVVQEWESFFIKNNIAKISAKEEVENFYKNSKYFLFDLCARSLENSYKEWMIYIGDKIKEYNCKSVLHYGSGIGDIPFYIAGNVHNLTLAEIESIPFLFTKWRHEREGMGNIKYVPLYNEELKDNADLFSCIICTDILEHRFEPYDYLEYIISLLEQEGLLILTTDFREILHYPLHVEENSRYRYIFKPEEFGLIRLNNRQPSIYRKTR